MLSYKNKSKQQTAAATENSIIANHPSNKNSFATTNMLILTPTNADNSDVLATVITNEPHSTARELATNINLNTKSKGLVHASALTVVKLSDFTTLSSANTLTIGINKSADISMDGPVLNSAGITTYLDIAVAINANTDMRAVGTYALPSDTDVTIISPCGYDIYVRSQGTARCAMQVLDHEFATIGAKVTVTDGNYLVGPGTVDLDTEDNVKIEQRIIANRQEAEIVKAQQTAQALKVVENLEPEALSDNTKFVPKYL
jgi:hypothetical protein